MKATIERAKLLRCLSHVQSVVERRNTIPILSNVLIEASAEGRVRITATDLDLQVVESLDAVSVETPGAIIERCLDTWTPDMLEVEFERRYGDSVQLHTRRSILLRLLSHDAYHSGEISQLLGLHDLPAIDLWARRPT